MSELSGAECEGRVAAFVEATATDEAHAHALLQEHSWDVGRAVEAFLDSPSGDSGPTPQESKEPATESGDEAESAEEGAGTDAQGPSEEEKTRRTAELATVTGTDASFAKELLQELSWDVAAAADLFFGRGPPPPLDLPKANGDAKATEEHKTASPTQFSLLTWNVDGISDRATIVRAKAAATLLLHHKPDVVHLQEVTQATERVIAGYVESEYDVHTSRGAMAEAYYTLSLLRRSSPLKLKGTRLVHFAASQMGRSALILRVEWRGRKLLLLNTHSESTKECVEERVRQQRECLELLEADAGPEGAALMAGDLNARDQELKAIPAFQRFKDAWWELGKPPGSRYTWDMMVNDNIGGWDKFKPRCRFDRCLYRDPTGHTLNPVGMELVGRQRIKGSGVFPSDHFGVLITFAAKE